MRSRIQYAELQQDHNFSDDTETDEHTDHNATDDELLTEVGDYSDLNDFSDEVRLLDLDHDAESAI